MRPEKTKAVSTSKTLQLFYEVSSRRKLGIVAASLILTFNFIEINVFFYESLRQYIEYPYSLISLIDGVTQYIYMYNYISLGKILYNVFRYTAVFINMLYLSLYLIIRLLLNKGTRIPTIDRIFEFFNNYYLHVLLLPVFEFLFRDLFCNESTLTALGEECLVGIHIATFALAILGTISGLIMTIMTVFYSMNGIYDKKNYFSGQNRYWEALLAILRLILPLLIANSDGSRTFLIAYTSFNIVASLVLLVFFMVFYPYNKLFIEYFTLIWLSLYFSQSLGNFIFIVSKNEDFNADYLFVCIFVFIAPGVLFLYYWMKQWLIFKGDVSSTQELLRQIQAILQLKRVEKLNSDEEIQFKGLISRHKIRCTNIKCFCKREELFDPKKNRDFELAKWTNLKPLILKYYVRFLFEDALAKGTRDNDLLIAYAEFLFQKFRNSHLASYQIHKVLGANKYLYPGHRFRIFKLQQKIHAYITMRNLESLEKALEIENIIFLEEQLETVLNGMKKIILSSIAFWSYLYNKDIELSKLKTLAEEMDGSVEETTKNWIPLKPYLNKQKRIMYYYNWFLKDLLQKKIILNEDEVDVLFDNDVASVYSNGFFTNLKDDHVIFQDDTAIIHMSGNATELGHILKTNRAAHTLFGYSKDELLRSNINILMPNLIAHKHDYYLNSHIITGKSKILYSEKKTFGKDKNGFIVPLWIVVKQLTNHQGQIQYGGLLRPLLQKKDDQNSYILMNNFGEINGMTKNLSNLLHLPKNLFYKSDINLILLAPKLIKHFFFAKILQQEKYKAQAASSFNFEVGGAKSALPFSTFSTFRMGLGMSGGRISPFMGTVGKKNPMKGFLELDRIKDEVTMTDENGDDVKEEDELSDDGIFREGKDGEMDVEFTLRIPKDLRKFARDFNLLKSRHHELLNNQQLLVDAIHTKTIHKSMQSAEEPASPTNIFRAKRKMIGHLANFKHAVDAYIGALRYTAERIVKTGKNNIYRVRGVVVTDYYGPDRDVIKYIKISDVVKKQEKFTRLAELESVKVPAGKSGPLQNDSNTSNIIQWNNSMSHSNMMKNIKKQKTLKTSNYSKTQRDSEEIKLKDTDTDNNLIEGPKTGRNRDGYPMNESSPEGTPKSKTMKRKDSMQSQKSDKNIKEEDPTEEDSKNSDASSERQAIMNELKNNILTHYQSIYQKEDNLQIDKNFRSLKNVKWFIRILFLALIPLNIIVYLVGPFTTYNQMGDSIDNIFTNEKLRRNYLRCHHSIITLLLDSNAYFDPLKVNQPLEIEDMLNKQITVLTESYSEMLTESTLDEWTIVLYEYAPQISEQTSVDFAGSFKGVIVDIQNAIQRLTNSLFEVISFTRAQFVDSDIDLQFYRFNSFEKFNKILGEVSIQIFESVNDDFQSTENLSIIILCCEGLLFFVSFLIILRLILIVIWSLRELLVIFTAIDNKQIVETERHFRRLLGYLEVSNKQYMTAHETFGPNYSRRETSQSKSLRMGDEQKQKLQKKFKKVNSVKFMREDTIRILIFYGVSVFVCFCLSLLFHFQSKLSGDAIQDSLIDGQKFIKLSSIYITSIVAFKELTYNQNTYEEYNLPYISNVLSEFERSLSKTGYLTNLDFVDTLMKILDGRPCETYRNLFANEDEYVQCTTFVDGRLSSGLISFHNYYADRISGALNLNDSGEYGPIEPIDVYQFSELIEMVDLIFMDLTLEAWSTNMKSYLTSKKEILAIVISIVSVLNLFVYFAAKKGVVGLLKKRFHFYRKIYNDYMLGEAPVKEKRIKAVLVKYKLLNK